MKSISFYLKPKAVLYLAVLCLTLPLAQSCVDKSYDWDDMDKSGVLNIPPIMLGDIDIIYLNGLSTGIFPGGLPVSGFKIALSDTISGIFDGDAIKDFFFEGANTVKFEAKADVVVKDAPANAKILLYFNVIDYNDSRISSVVIPKQELRKGEGQELVIEIASQYMEYMKNAKSLELTIVITSDAGVIQIDSQDYIFLNSVIVKTGGYHFEL